MSAEAAELLDLNQKLLESIFAADWETYRRLCDPTISCFEAEARGQLVEGLDFHQFYFGLPRSGRKPQVTMTAPRVRLLGSDGAVVAYVRLVQFADDAGNAKTTKCEETRVWQKFDGQWRHVHFHRSMNE